MKIIYSLCIILLLFVLPLILCNQKVSTLNVLFPICVSPKCLVVYQINAFNGCYKWNFENTPLLSSIQNHLKIIKSDEECNEKIELQSTVNQTFLNLNLEEHLWLIPTDINTGKQFKIRVGFSILTKISITKRFDIINVDEVAELDVQGYDEKGNQFSSLEGLSFKWYFTVSNMSDFAYFSRLSEEKKMCSTERAKIEKSSFSDLIVLTGKSPGKVSIVSELVDFSGVKSEKRDIFVIKPFTIIPNEIYILKEKTYKIKLFYENLTKEESSANNLKQNESNLYYYIKHINLKPYQSLFNIKDYTKFSWSNDSNCGKIDQTKSNKYITYNSENINCVTTFIAKDDRSSEFNQAKLKINVVDPDNLEIGIRDVNEQELNLLSEYFKFQKNGSGLENMIEKELNLEESESGYFSWGDTKTEDKIKTLMSQHNGYEVMNNWKLISGKFYFIKHYLYYNNNKITINGDLEYEISNSSIKALEKYLKIIMCLNKKQVCLIFAKEESNSYNLSLTSNTLTKLNLKCTKSINIYSKLSIKKFNQTFFVLPKTNKPQELNLIIDGGSGSYFISSEGITIKIKENVIYSNEIGSSIVKVTDREINSNYDEIEIKVTNPNEFRFNEEKIEVLEGQPFRLSVVGYSNLMKFTNCTNIEGIISLTEEFEEVNFIAEKEKNTDYESYANNFNCQIKQYLSKLSSKFSAVFESNEKLKSSVPAQIRVYKKLTINYHFEDSFSQMLMLNTNQNDPYISLVPGSSKSFEIINGSEKWQDEKHFTEVKLFKLDKSINKFAVLNDNYLNVKCEEIGEYKISISKFNLKSEKLKNPILTSINIPFICNIPSSLGIYFNELEKQDPSVFVIPQPEIDYFFRKDATQSMRLYGYDDNKRVFHNINFLQSEMNFTNNFMRLIKEEKKYEEFLYSKISIEDLYLKKKLYLTYCFNEKNIFTYLGLKSNMLTADDKDKVKNYIDSKPSKLSATAIVNILNTPVIEPSVMTIAPWMNFEFQILHGSGEYTISYSTPSPIIKLINKRDGNITGLISVEPKESMENTKITITISDKHINGHTTKCHLYISALKSINLQGGGLMQEGGSLKFTIIAVSHFDSIFPASFFNSESVSLRFSFLPEKSKLEIADFDYIKNRISRYEFTAFGHKSDIYSLSVILESNKIKSLESNSISIEVFDKVKIYPPYLLMVPGTSFTVTITNGPKSNPNLQRVFSIKNSELASIDKDSSIVHANKIGITTLELKIIETGLAENFLYSTSNQSDKHEKIICFEIIPVEIAFPEKADILLGSNRKIFKNSSIRLLTVLKKDSRIFTFAVGPIYYEWMTDQPQVAKLKTRFSSKSYCCESDNTCSGSNEQNTIEIGNNIGVFVKSISKGEAIISSKVIIDYPHPYQERQPNQFIASEKLLVDESMFFNISEFYEYNPNKSGNYLLPFNIVHDLKANKDDSNLIYSKVNSNSDSIFEITKQGRITTFNNQGLAQVLIEQNKKTDSPFVPTILSLYITDFYSLFVEKSFQLLDIDVGQEIELKIVIQHEYGLIFADNLDGLKLASLESHPSIAFSSLFERNSKIKIKALSKGRTNIVIFNPINLAIYDCFMVNVHASTVMPDSINITIGGEIDFLGKEPQRKETITANAKWISTNPSVFYINPVSGKGHSITEGTSRILLIDNTNNKTKLSSQVNVFTIKRTYLDKSLLPEFTTNYKKSINYKQMYPIKLEFLIQEYGDAKLHNNTNDQLNIIKHNIKFKCQPIEHQKIIFRTDNFVDDKENHYCNLFINENLDFKLKSPKSLDVSIQVSDNNSFKNSSSSIVKIPFINGFKLNHYFVTLSKNKPSEEIEINTGIRDLEYKIESNESEVDKRISTVLNIVEEDFSSMTLLVNDVNEDIQFKLIFTHKITQQTEECIISYFSTNIDKEERFLFFKKKDLTDILTVLLIFGTIYIAIKYYYYSNPELNTVHNYIHPHFSGQATPSQNMVFNSSFNNPYSNNVYSSPYNKQNSGSKFNPYTGTSQKN